jgi:peptide/nickel transport system substrate-binding protein
VKKRRLFSSGLARSLVVLSAIAFTACAPAAPAVPTSAPAKPTTAPAAPAATNKPAPTAPIGAPPATAVPAPTGAAAATTPNDPSRDRGGSGGTLIVGMTSDNVPAPQTPPPGGAEGIRWVGNQVYDALTLFNLDQDEVAPTPQPGLAETWTISTDKLVWTFNLRKGVKFHDGTDFNADAVVFQLDRLLNKDFEFYDKTTAASNNSYTGSIASYRAVDADTVEIKTKTPYGLLIWDLTSVFFPSPTAVKTFGNQEYVNHAAGTGPFKIARYVDGQVMELVPNAGYWGGKPKLDKLVLRPMPDAAARLAALQSGDINLADAVPPDAVRSLKAQGYTILLKPYPHVMNVLLNLSDGVFTNPKVREALQYAVDRDKMCTDLLSGLCIPAYQTAYPGQP